jgi:hypothetical protein
MIDLNEAFAALPPPVPNAREAEDAHRIWLRARIAAIVDDERSSARVTRLRMATAVIAVAAADAIVPMLLASAAVPLAGILGAMVITHAITSLALLRA